ncbi:hypothetical protein AB4519_23775 [Vibrio splendidus]|uniref:hypothetical protein n=1 Tax=Vibrio splendidus TaxID=29497 RepID=UPI000D353E29|nr:hypothetical protein [Vibrio splendidus]PTP57013.1 hypothetical protein CWN83_05670 [Vibrio splendidus]
MEKIVYYFYISKPSHYVTVLKIIRDKKINFNDCYLIIYGHFSNASDFYNTIINLDIWEDVYFFNSRFKSSLNLYRLCKKHKNKGHKITLFYDNDFGKESLYLKLIKPKVEMINLFDDGHFSYLEKIPYIGGNKNKIVRLVYQMFNLPSSYGSSKYIDEYYLFDIDTFKNKRTLKNIQALEISSSNLSIKDSLKPVFKIPHIVDNTLTIFCLPKILNDVNELILEIIKFRNSNIYIKMHPGSLFSFSKVQDMINSTDTSINILEFDSLIPIEVYLDIVEVEDVFLFHYGSSIGLYSNENKKMIIKDLL